MRRDAAVSTPKKSTATPLDITSISRIGGTTLEASQIDCTSKSFIASNQQKKNASVVGDVIMGLDVKAMKRAGAFVGRMQCKYQIF